MRTSQASLLTAQQLWLRARQRHALLALYKVVYIACGAQPPPRKWEILVENTMRKPEHSYFFNAARHTGALSQWPKVLGNGWEAACCKRGNSSPACHSSPAVQSIKAGNSRQVGSG